MVTCNEYLELIGPETVVCNQGDWKMGVPSCKRKFCKTGNILLKTRFMSKSSLKQFQQKVRS